MSRILQKTNRSVHRQEGSSHVVPSSNAMLNVMSGLCRILDRQKTSQLMIAGGMSTIKSSKFYPSKYRMLEVQRGIREPPEFL